MINVRTLQLNRPFVRRLISYPNALPIKQKDPRSSHVTQSFCTTQVEPLGQPLLWVPNAIIERLRRKAISRTRRRRSFAQGDALIPSLSSESALLNLTQQLSLPAIERSKSDDISVKVTQQLLWCPPLLSLWKFSFSNCTWKIQELAKSIASKRTEPQYQ